MKNRKKAPKVSTKREQSTLRVKKTISVKSRFLQYVQCGSLDLEVPNLEISSQKSIKKWPGSTPENNMILQVFWSPETDINRSHNHSNIELNPVIYHLESILHAPPGWSRDAKMAPVKKDAPSFPNGNPKPKGAGGRGRGPKIKVLNNLRST